MKLLNEKVDLYSMSLEKEVQELYNLLPDLADDIFNIIDSLSTSAFIRGITIGLKLKGGLKNEFIYKRK